VRNDNVQAIGGAALKDDNETLVTRTRVNSAESGAGKKAGHCRRADDGERAVVEKDAAGNHW
jgi:hypothetical protein